MFKREVMPDPVYDDKTVTKLINNIMLDGKKVLPKKLFMVLLILSKKLQEKTLLKYSTKQ